MVECEFCNKNRIVTIKFELFNTEIEPFRGEEPDSKRICLICLEKRNWKIDIREVFQLLTEDLIDFPENYFKEE